MGGKSSRVFTWGRKGTSGGEREHEAVFSWGGRVGGGGGGMMHLDYGGGVNKTIHMYRRPSMRRVARVEQAWQGVLPQGGGFLQVAHNGHYI